MTPVKSNKLRKAARDQACVMCAADDGTVVLAHLPFRNSGMGIKAPDICGAHLCFGCHHYADGDGRMDHEWRFMALSRTLERLWRNGVVK
jgi:hypothetical protein